MATNRTVAVYGAYGHTGRFVVSELRRRSWRPVLCGRDAAKLQALSRQFADLEVRLASVDDAAALDRAFADAAAVINCAGPFLDTAAPVIEAALRARMHYLDVAAEQAAVLATFERFAAAARDTGVSIVPAMGFYGGLSDLLATAAMGNWADADEICIAIALDSWAPTQGTRLTGQRNPGQRFVYSKHRLERGDPPPSRIWNFPAPFGAQEVVGLTLAETITIPRHLQVPELRTYMNRAPLVDLRNPDTPAPTAADESGRSLQIFVVDVIVRRGDEARRISAQGRDIYATTAPLVVNAALELCDGSITGGGVAAAGEIFDAQAFLNSLCPEHLALAQE